MKWLKIKVLFVELLNNLFSVFKEYFTYFHIFFHLYIFQKPTNINTQISPLNKPYILGINYKWQVVAIWLQFLLTTNDATV